ncbi:hypothetical protein A3F58_02585 [Candidatus Roizmanbacteria bacterium RIFCSPHIGHO2_12_FULL_37_9b]|uniref:Aminoglycoside phosphotransferase domain-containing protein n=1 Tax=Candidatus Roizmanbacteria bacterium RIFCSPHIGHO2_02_FULL_38_11 TaxID=1802039 RepID=A0A1F7GXQ0_9BACT|nr:MAG: hypothetical protein A3C25_06365 [Candidatus Roizmanbacteria bacterium RIFCSPHIGHO2_02_FULL_38_11]OGK35164.1 MAG: hypothetical protein A3F58_02585 [Candidatus Roizmanbacteria bacterium RIFCSPHIGHO2_12_FULL_37_9b]
MTLEPKEIKSTAEGNSLAVGINSEVASCIGVKPEEIEWSHSFLEVIADKTRYGHGFTLKTEKYPQGFVKIAKNKICRAGLRREMTGLHIAKKLGVKTVSLLLSTYLETTSGYGVIFLRRLNHDEGITIPNNEALATAPRELGAIAAKFILRSTGQVVPINLSADEKAALNRNDERNSSPESFWRIWSQQNAEVLKPEFDEIRDRLVSKATLLRIINKAEFDIRPFVDAPVQTGRDFLIHNDMTPNNIGFPHLDKPKEETTLFDFEYAGATDNRFLALCTDLGNYYGRLWPNPAMQEDFILTLLDDSALCPPSERLKMAQAFVVFGTFYMAQFAMSPAHYNHQMSIELLKRLQGNLNKLKDRSVACKLA